MADKNFYLEIVTPKRIVFKGDVSSFTAPGAAGGFQVLRSHAPLLSNIQAGVVKVIDASGKEMHYATSGGVVEVRDNQGCSPRRNSGKRAGNRCRSCKGCAGSCTKTIEGTGARYGYRTCTTCFTARSQSAKTFRYCIIFKTHICGGRFFTYPQALIFKNGYCIFKTNLIRSFILKAGAKRHSFDVCRNKS